MELANFERDKKSNDMNFFQQFRRKRLQKRINSISKRYRNNKFHYIKKNQTIGLIINATDKDTIRLSEDFENYLVQSGNQIEKIFFLTEKTKKKEVLPEKTISIHGCKWVKSEIVENFSKHTYDILFVLNFSELFEIHYLLNVIDADLKVSPHYNERNYADLTFVLDEKSMPEDFFDAVKKYLVEA